MQTLCTVDNIATYIAACNPFDIISRPEVCPACNRRDCFHRNGTYKRYVSRYQIKVARFLCKYCGVTVSVLPCFALPYRYQSLDETDCYFRASDEQRRNLSGADLLRRYWRRWIQHCPTLQRFSGSASARLERDPLRYWRQLSDRDGG